MKKLISVLSAALVICAAAYATPVKGTVSAAGKGIRNVSVTDGYTVVKTDKKGRYKMEAAPEAEFIYISLPSGYAVPQRNGAPLFYSEVKPQVNFQLRKEAGDQNRHNFVVWADVQVYEAHEIDDYVKVAAQEVFDWSQETGIPTFGVSCGDIVGDSKDDMLVDVQNATACCGIPFFTLMGNHDYVPGGDNESSKDLYQSHFGPNYYSFDRGLIHYVVLDDVFYYGRNYMGFIEEPQMEWLKQDLSFAPEGSTVVLFMHIPTYSVPARHGDWGKEEMNKILTNRSELYAVLKPFNAHICSAHEHYIENYIIADNLMEHVHGPLSGLFWQSTLSWDGVPWGYTVYEVDGADIKWYYKPVGLDKSNQFTAYDMGEDPMKPDCVVANVWNYDSKWKVEWSEDGVPQGEMTRYRGWDRSIVNDVDKRREKEFKWKYIGAGPTEHLFYAKPSRADAEVDIKVTDHFGNVYTWSNGRSVLGISETAAANVPVNDKYGVFHGTCQAETDLYNLAIEEMVKDIEPDGTWRTGELWPGVWTRDISYSTILSLAHYEPDVCLTSLMCKVDSLGRIIQDTGTGGSWPCSTDRLIWIGAIWELYNQTGDIEWLEEIYPIVRRSLYNDFVSVYDGETGLFRGESSFIDWRVQSYPTWMQPVDISQSECLGTNAVFYKAIMSASMMAQMLGYEQEALDFLHRGADLADAINENLWMEDKGYYAQFLYGRQHKMISPRSETLGEALCILFGIASDEQAESIMKNMPVSEFGPTIFWPQIASQGNYHNNAIWPFVTSYYAVAASETSNQAALELALKSNMSFAAQYGTNYENMVSSTGEPNTLLNSPRQLWSVAGYLGMYQRIIFGMWFWPEGIYFSPVIPASMPGLRTLEGWKYRGMTLDISVYGTGSKVRKFKLDGKELKEPFLDAHLTGHHKVEIDMVPEDYYAEPGTVNVGKYTTAPDNTVATLTEDSVLEWLPVAGAAEYVVYRNGKEFARTPADSVSVALDQSGEYTVVAVDAEGISGFMSEPIMKFEEREVVVGYREMVLNNSKGTQTVFNVKVNDPGLYAIDFEYSNGNGTIDTYNKCAVRTLYIDGERADVAVFPQRGDSWEDAGWSNTAKVYLSEGRHTVQLKYEHENVNMNILVDEAVLHCIRLIKID